MPNATMKKKVRYVRYIRNMKKKVRSYSSGNLSFFLDYGNNLYGLSDSHPFIYRQIHFV